MAKKQTNKIKFHEKLILFKYILNLFKVDSLDKLGQILKDTYLEEIDVEKQQTKFFQVISNRFVFDEEYLTVAQLERYDENIIQHTKHINEKRKNPIKWKYFQYLELLFTEIYLDKYFSNKEDLLASLNAFRERYNKECLKSEEISEYSENDLNKIAFWAATGSGKTLLLHMNILQIQYYLKLHGKQKDYNRIILITPNEGLSVQHKQELELSNIEAKIFDKTALAQAGTPMQMSFLHQQNSDIVIDIIEITKLADETGDKTIAVEAFESNNIILVDEGHRGASSSKDGSWIKRRNALSKEGFCFEYSATFGQAVVKDNDLTNEYAKCILFDYSYKYFYEDGYGKEYQILNLEDDSEEDRKTQYLTACLLTYFQQMLLFKDKKIEFNPFLIEKPLWIFVGASVIGNRSNIKNLSSDVVDILLFINDFVSKKNKTVEFLDNLLNGQDGFLDSRRLSIFENKFTYLISKKYTGETLYTEILQTIFNSVQQEANLYIENLKGVDGEIGLKIGTNDYFGVINVGDNDSLIKLCEANSLHATSVEFSDSLFHGINKKDSKINVLIGSKKFSEGWSSWRVSTMGLMNIGKTEGAQIIQLFGRGVRLKGANYSLKRSDYQDFISKKPAYIKTIETLNIFGVKSAYMATFKEYLELEDLPTGNKIEFSLPTISNLGIVKTPLKMPRLKEGIDFKKDGGCFSLDLPPSDFISRPIELDMYTKVQLTESTQKISSVITKNEEKLDEEKMAFIDYQELFFELQKLKNEKKYYNLNLSINKIKAILEDSSWYKLYIPQNDIAFTDFRKVLLYQDIAVRLLKKYCERYYTNKKDEWEAQYRKYVEIDENDPNIVSQYKLYIEDSKKDIIEKLEQLKASINNREYEDIEFRGLKTIGWDNHLYTPLISFKSKSEIKITPVQLNTEEIKFVEDLKSYFEKEKDYFNDKELYLLRNQGKGRGTGFFEANNFYPDFVMWLIYNNKQYITFIDPKGLMHISGISNPKIQFHKEIKNIQEQMNDLNVELNSIILSNTPFKQLSLAKEGISKEEFNHNNVVFQEDRNYIKQIFSKITV